MRVCTTQLSYDILRLLLTITFICKKNAQQIHNDMKIYFYSTETTYSSLKIFSFLARMPKSKNNFKQRTSWPFMMKQYALIFASVIIEADGSTMPVKKEQNLKNNFK